MGHASLVLLLCATSVVPMYAQENGLSQPPSPAAPLATPNLFNTTRAPKQKSALHPIPLALSYNHYVHEIPLSKTWDYYVHEIPVAAREQVGVTRLISEKTRPINPNR